MAEKHPKFFLIAAAVFAIVSCSNEAVPDDSKISIAAEFDWTTLPDGSVLAVRQNTNDTSLQRCWKQSVDYECVYAFQIGELIRVHAMHKTEPKHFNDWTENDMIGYGCEIFLNVAGPNVEIFKETISSARGYLKTNLVSMSDSENKPWSRTEVTKFIKLNDLDVKRQWFNCGFLVKAIDTGSIHSLGTSDMAVNNVF